VGREGFDSPFGLPAIAGVWLMATGDLPLCVAANFVLFPWGLSPFLRDEDEDFVVADEGEQSDGESLGSATVNNEK
jgi:hypothetical protein